MSATHFSDSVRHTHEKREQFNVKCEVRETIANIYIAHDHCLMVSKINDIIVHIFSFKKLLSLCHSLPQVFLFHLTEVFYFTYLEHSSEIQKSKVYLLKESLDIESLFIFIFRKKWNDLQYHLRNKLSIHELWFFRKVSIRKVKK